MPAVSKVVGASRNNRKRSRAFLDFLRRFHVPLPGEEEDAPALEPDEPRIIL